MCGRYAANLTPEEIYARWGIVEFAQLRLPPVVPVFNVAPTSVMPIVAERASGRRLEALKWGFFPYWMTPGKAPPPINARAETVATNGLFKRALSERRCIVPATGFYEWQAVAGEKRKRPYHIRLQDASVFGFAGIYTPPPNDELPGTYCIITTTPNDVLSPIHDRMPVILSPEWEALWLDPTVTDPAAVLQLLRPLAPERVEAFRVGYDVGTPANDRPDLVAPLS